MRSIVLACILLSTSACAQEIKKPVSTCSPTPCVELNQQQLSVIGPILGQQYSAVKQQYQVLDSVLANIQKQIDDQKPKESKK